MRTFYAKDLDELIVFRSEEFISKQMPEFTEAEIDTWNHYNEDITILPYAESYTFDKPVQETHFNKAEGHDIDYRILYAKIKIEEKPHVLMSRIPMIEDSDLYATMITQYGSLFIILLVALTIFQRIISGKLWKPFHRTLNKVEDFSLEAGIIPEFEPTTTTEFSRLNEQLSNLMTDNLSIYKRQKEFIENASHELQTPLAVFKSQLDMLLQQPDLTQSHTEIIRSLYNVAARMTRMNKNLLLLARIDNDQFTDIKPIDFVDTLNEQLKFLGELAASEGLTLNIEANGPLQVEANKILLESLINNLVVNAIRHNTKNGMINIQVRENGFEVANTGAKKALDPEKIFHRFSRTSEERKGNGLGLSIVKQICKMHGWNIHYSYAHALHIFTVTFH